MTDHDPNPIDRNPFPDELDDDSPVAAALSETRALLREGPASEPTAALTEFVSVAPRPDQVEPQLLTPQRTRTMLERLTNSSRAPGRVALVATVGVAALAGVAALSLGPNDDAGLAAASGSNSTSTSTSSPTTSPTTPPAPGSSTTAGSAGSRIADQGPTVVPVAEVGSVTVEVVDGRPVLIASEVSSGWRLVEETPDEPDELDLSFRNGDDRIDVDIEPDDGTIRVRIRDRRTGDERVTSLDGRPLGDDRSDDDSYDDSHDDSYDDSHDDSLDDDSHDDDSTTRTTTPTTTPTTTTPTTTTPTTPTTTTPTTTDRWPSPPSHLAPCRGRGPAHRPRASMTGAMSAVRSPSNDHEVMPNRSAQVRKCSAMSSTVPNAR